MLYFKKYTLYAAQYAVQYYSIPHATLWYKKGTKVVSGAVPFTYLPLKGAYWYLKGTY